MQQKLEGVDGGGARGRRKNPGAQRLGFGVEPALQNSKRTATEGVACREAVPAARLACRGVHALNYFFSPARRVSASDAVSADVAGNADGRVHGSHRAEPRAMRCHVAASASYGPWKRRATSSTSTRRRARMRLASRRPSRVRASASRWRRRENLKSGTKIAKEKSKNKIKRSPQGS